MIRQNRHKYSIAAMCDVLQIPKSTYYYEPKAREYTENELVEQIVQIFKDSRQNYGQRKIKVEFAKLG